MSKILTDFQDGIHTYEISQPLTKKQFLAVYDRMHAKGRLIHNKKGGGSCESYNGALLKEASNEAVSVIQSYLHKMFPCNGIHLRYKDAMSAVRRVKKKEQRERMLYLLRKASDAATLDSAAQKVKDHYTDVNSKKRKKIYANFDKQGINPITLPNNSHIEKIPPLNTLFRK